MGRIEKLIGISFIVFSLLMFTNTITVFLSIPAWVVLGIGVLLVMI